MNLGLCWPAAIGRITHFPTPQSEIRPSLGHYWEQIEQQVNRIWIVQHFRSDISLTQSEIAELEAIANLCPRNGGPSVGRAKDMLMLWQAEHYNEGDPIYMYDYICNEPAERLAFEDASSRPQAPGEAEIDYQLTIYPNPADKLLAVRYEVETGVDIHFQLWNTAGKVVRDLTLDANASGQAFSIEYLSSGIYFGVWKINGAWHSGERIIIH
ncbi:MAG: T9SS type A sorting domain-containing protein [Bacteroidia bacterium]